MDSFKGKMHLKPKLSMFCALSQKYQDYFEKIKWESWRKLSEKLKNGIKILIGQVVLELLVENNILHVLINNSKTAWLVETWIPSLSFSYNLL